MNGTSEPIGIYRDIILDAVQRLCGDVESSLASALVDTARMRKLAVGEVLYRQGDQGSSLHVVLTGRLQVTVTGGDSGSRVVAFPQPGDAVGEMALLSGSARAATVIAVRDTLVAQIEKTQLDAVISVCPAVFAHIAKVIIERLTGLQGRITRREGARSLMVLPIHCTSVTEEFAARLRCSLLGIGSVLHLAERSAAVRFHDVTPEDYGRRIDECEAQYEHLLLESNGQPSDWTLTCLGYADTILLVCDATLGPGITSIERWLSEEPRFKQTHARVELVIIHPRHARPHGSSAWLDARRIAQHHHVRVGNADDTDRVARFLCGKAIGLVLAGGGARGFAHMGVIRAIEEVGIPIDAIGGASFGALVATGPARQMPYESIFAEQQMVFENGDPLGDYTLPIVSLVRGQHLDGILQTHLPQQIEDLFVPYFSVSSDISANQVRVHDSGPLWKAVRASISLPAILPPTLDHGHLLVDGGVMNNLPVDVLRTRMRGPIIAVDLAAQGSSKAIMESVPSSLEYLKSRILPRRKAIDAPTVSRVILQVTTLASKRDVLRNMKIADVYLNPPTGAYDFLDWSRMAELQRVGYEFAVPKLAEWLASNPSARPRGQALRNWQHHTSRTNA